MTERFIRDFLEKVSRAVFWCGLNKNRTPFIADLEVELKCPVPMPNDHLWRLRQNVFADAIVPTGGGSVVRFPFRIEDTLMRRNTKTRFILIMTPILDDDMRVASHLLLSGVKMEGRHLLPNGREILDDDLFSSEITEIIVRFGKNGEKFTLPNAFGMPNSDENCNDETKLAGSILAA